jgi:hypothetical protein
MVVLVLAPASAHGQHSKVSLESIGPAGGNGPSRGPRRADDTDNRPYLHPEALTSADTTLVRPLFAQRPHTTLASGSRRRNAPSGPVRRTGPATALLRPKSGWARDTDNSLDVYMREGIATTLVSTGPGAGAFGAYDSFFAGSSADGTRAFFTTRGALVGADNDQSFDVYERSNGNTSLVSTGPAGGNGPYGATWRG